MWHIKLMGMNRWAEQNASKIFILGSNWWPCVRSKFQISCNFGYHINFKHLYSKLCIKERKHIEQNFHFVVTVISQVWDLGCWGLSKPLAWGFTMKMPGKHWCRLGPSINGLVTDGNTKLCCRSFILAYFKVLQPIKLILNIHEIIRGYSRYAKLKYYELR